MKIDPKEIKLLPNLISLFRLLLFIPLLFLFNLAGSDWSYRQYILYVIVAAFISDVLDGFVARKTNKISELGKIIDPLADKTLMIIIVINLFILQKVPNYFFYVIVLRDVLIFIGGIFLSNKLNKVLPSNLLGKLTVMSIGIFILSIFFDIDSSSTVYRALLVISIVMSIISVAGYAIRAIEFLKKSNRSENVTQI